MMDQAATLRIESALNKKVGDEKIKKGTKPPRVIAVTSGKGGTGKSNVVANLAYALTLSGERVMILDADLGLGNMDILLGLSPKYSIHDVIKGRKSLSEVVVEGPGGMKILPAGSGIEELNKLTEGEKLNLIGEFDLLQGEIDTFFLDTGAGISSNVMYFNTAAQEIIVVVSPEPTSVTDAYAIMKVLSTSYSERHFKLLVNSVKSEKEALDVFENLCTVADKFLNISIDYMGHVPYDKSLPKAVMRQKAVVDLYPRSPASISFLELARKVQKNVPKMEPKGNMQFFWSRILDAIGGG